LALREAVALRKSQVQECQAAAADALEGDDDDLMVRAKFALVAARKALEKVKERLRRQEAALGVLETQELTKMGENKYFELRMNARAVKRRLRDVLRAKKFERDRIERTSRRQQGEGEVH
jgi:hypothetical protein